MGIEYPLKDVKIPTDEEVRKAKEILGIYNENHSA